MCSNIISTIGLPLDIFGVILLFFFAPIQPDHFDDGSIKWEGDDKEGAEKIKKDTEKRKAKYNSMSKIALTLILIGFILQLVSLWT